MGFTSERYTELYDFLNGVDPSMAASFAGCFVQDGGNYVLNVSLADYEYVLGQIFGDEGDFTDFLAWNTTSIGSSTQGGGTV